jgi:hypothetical protein
MEETIKRIECPSLKLRIKLLDDILYNTISQRKFPYDLYDIHINHTLDKIEKLEKRYYNLCTRSKESFEE